MNAPCTPRQITMLLAAALLVTIAPPPAAAQTMWGSDNGGTLYSMNLATGHGTPFCLLQGPTGATEIEYDDISGILWTQGVDGTFYDSGFDIHNCAPLTGPMPNGWSFNGLEFVGTTLYGTGIHGPCAQSTLCRINPMTGGVAPIGPTGFGPISGLAYNVATGIMYGITGCSQLGPPRLLVINLANGQAASVGPPQPMLDAGSLEFGPDGRLYVGGGVGDGGRLWVIPPPFNVPAIPIGPTGFSPVTGLTMQINPTPARQSTWGSVKVLYR